MSWKTCADPGTLDTDGAGWNGFTLRVVISSAALSNTSGSTKVRVTFEASSGGQNLYVESAYIGSGSSGGDAYDFSAAPTQITFDTGNAYVDITAGNQEVSDEITYTVDGAKDLVITAYFNDANKDDLRYKSSVSNWESYYKAADEPDTQDVTGYTTGGFAGMVALVEVFVSGGQVMLFS